MAERGKGWQLGIVLILMLFAGAIACGGRRVTPTEPPPTVEEAATQDVEAGPGTSQSDPDKGTITGEVLYRSGEVGQPEYQPDTDARIYVEGHEDVHTAPDEAGHFTLSDVPPGLQVITARSPRGVDTAAIPIVEGQTYEHDFATFVGDPQREGYYAGGYVRVNENPAEGAFVWTVSEIPILLETDSEGYFSLLYAGEPVMVVYEDYWDIVTLEAEELIDIELTRENPVATIPDVPVGESLPVGYFYGVLVVITPTPPFWIIMPVEPIEIAPIISAVVFPTACDQTNADAEYGQMEVGTEVILGRHTEVDGDANWASDMDLYVGERATVTELAGVDGQGCPTVRVDIDGGEFVWRIRDLIYALPE